MPSAAMRVAFFWAEARPFFRRTTIACSMSPLASVSAFLQSIIPAPVFSRSSFTLVALISILILFEQKNSRELRERNRRLTFSLHHCGFVRRFDCRLVVARNASTFRLGASSERHDDAFILIALIAFIGLRRGDAFLIYSLAFNDRFRDLRSKETDRSQRVVVTRNHVVDNIGIAVGIH